MEIIDKEEVRSFIINKMNEHVDNTLTRLHGFIAEADTLDEILGETRLALCLLHSDITALENFESSMDALAHHIQDAEDSLVCYQDTYEKLLNE